jgi:hypothetical protein
MARTPRPRRRHINLLFRACFFLTESGLNEAAAAA